jgi:hypothetical protein
MSGLFPFAGLRLLLPAIMPSWRFFDAVTASPRLDYALLAAADETVEQWREFRPRADSLAPTIMLRRLLWNPEWNENLFIVSLSERLMRSNNAETEAHSERELLLRVARHLHRHGLSEPGARLQIRLRFVSRSGPTDTVESRIAYISTPRPIADLVTP